MSDVFGVARTSARYKNYYIGGFRGTLRALIGGTRYRYNTRKKRTLD